MSFSVGGPSLRQFPLLPNTIRLSFCTSKQGSVYPGRQQLSRTTVLCSSSNPSFIQAALSAVHLDALASPHPGLVVGLGAATTVFAFGLPVLLSGLTPAGVLTSWLLGSLVFAAFGSGGFFLVCIYFILGSAVTKFKLKEKTEKGIAEVRGGKRGPVRFWRHISVHCYLTAVKRCVYDCLIFYCTLIRFSVCCNASN